MNRPSAENVTGGFKWAIEAKRERNAKMIVGESKELRAGGVSRRDIVEERAISIARGTGAPAFLSATLPLC